MHMNTAKITTTLLVAVLLSSCQNPFSSNTDSDAESYSLQHESNLPDLSKQPVTDGIVVKNMDRFWEKWNLVTVRYRPDQSEQRFIYANPIAWEAIKNRKLPYPDGAVLGKISFHMSEDPAFPISQIPQDPVRIQLMEKNASRYPQTDGWGYAVVFIHESDEVAKAKTDQTRAVPIACHSCHRIVSKRDFVFEEYPVFFGRTSDAHAQVGAKVSEGAKLFKNQFKLQKAESLDPRDLKIIGSENFGVPLTQFKGLSIPLFSGTIAESAILLAQYAEEDSTAYLISDPSTEQLLAAFPQNPNRVSRPHECNKNVTLLMSQYVRFMGMPAGFSFPANLKDLSSPYAIGIICRGKIEWIQRQGKQSQ